MLGAVFPLEATIHVPQGDATTTCRDNEWVFDGGGGCLASATYLVTPPAADGIPTASQWLRPASWQYLEHDYCLLPCGPGAPECLPAGTYEARIDWACHGGPSDSPYALAQDVTMIVDP